MHICYPLTSVCVRLPSAPLLFHFSITFFIYILLSFHSSRSSATAQFGLHVLFSRCWCLVPCRPYIMFFQPSAAGGMSLPSCATLGSWRAGQAKTIPTPPHGRGFFHDGRDKTTVRFDLFGSIQLIVS